MSYYSHTLSHPSKYQKDSCGYRWSEEERWYYPRMSNHSNTFRKDSREYLRGVAVALFAVDTAVGIVD